MNTQEIIKKLNLEQKCALLSGATTFGTRALPKNNIPSITLSDGPNGVRKQAGAADHLGLNPSVPATCFPTAATVACSWDPALGEQIGQAMGEEAAAQEVAVLLGPGLNTKRSPLCGRNFEYFSEDPYLSGKMAAGYVRGIQSNGIAACPKHFAVNSQELRRMASDSVLDERTLREIYLPHKDEVDGIALSLPGFIDAEQGVVRGGGAPSLAYNVGTPVGPRLAEACGCRVWIENDGKAAAIAELERGVLKGCRNAAVFIIGTGVGGGLIIDGKLVRGRDCTAGEYSFMNTNADAWSDPAKSVACQCSTSGLLSGYRARKGLPADAPMDGRIFFEAVHAGETEANEALRSFCRAVAVQIYNLNVLLDLEKVAIGGGISKQPILVETLNEVYEEYILRGHPFSEAQARCLPRPEIVPCRFLSEANQIGAFASYQKAFLEK